jgi:hypothetical protein
MNSVKQLNFKFDSYPTGVEERVAKELKIETTIEEVNCGLWEEKECTIENNFVSSSSFCEKHSEKVAEVTYSWKSWNSDKLSTRTEIYYRTPRVLIAINEGNNNSTGVCVDCLLEYLKEE